MSSLKLRKNENGVFVGATADTMQRLDKISVGETIEVKPVKKNVKLRRSTKQNAYYWGVVLEMLENSLGNGMNKEQIHTVLKIGCLGGVEYMGVVIPKKSTADLSTEEMEEYLRWVREWAANLRGIYIPLPNECGYEY